MKDAQKPFTDEEEHTYEMHRCQCSVCEKIQAWDYEAQRKEIAREAFEKALQDVQYWLNDQDTKIPNWIRFDLENYLKQLRQLRGE